MWKINVYKYFCVAHENCYHIQAENNLFAFSCPDQELV